MFDEIMCYVTDNAVRTSFVARVSHEAISEVEPLSTDI